MSSTKFLFFKPIGKLRWTPWPLIGWDITDFSSETAERNSTKLDREQDLNVLYQVCVFRADPKNKMAALASDRLRHFRLLLWTEFNKTWQEARSQCPLPSLCFFFLGGGDKKKKTRWPPWPLIGGDIFDFFSETAERNSTKLDSMQDLNVLYQVCVFGLIGKKQDGRPGLWLAETFSSSPLKPLNGIQRNLTGSKISMSFTKFVFFWPISKTRWPPWPLIRWDIFDFSSERNSTKLDRKKDLNDLYQVFVFWADRKNNMTALANPSKRWHIVVTCTICGPLGLLLYGDSDTPPHLVAFYDTLGIRRTYYRLKPPASSRGSEA